MKKFPWLDVYFFFRKLNAKSWKNSYSQLMVKFLCHRPRSSLQNRNNSRLSFCAAQLRHTVHTHPLLANVVSLRFIIERQHVRLFLPLSSSDDSPKSTYSVRISLRPYIHRRFMLTLVSIILRFQI